MPTPRKRARAEGPQALFVGIHPRAANDRGIRNDDLARPRPAPTPAPGKK
ncbi:MAG: hypothetical protein KGL18_18230 [Burkholderiales bacterium]|nr:hypothetical protein [Burkholderiales bacterium]MDE1927609.1 hypothetical protein [Burkholderiales bacterium]MDE2160720.1 hypothetical protein [Burkholderiales bacterium]MDE2504905.1 hypothetical protein [Burkholderiales bacterium]